MDKEQPRRQTHPSPLSPASTCVPPLSRSARELLSSEEDPGTDGRGGSSVGGGGGGGAGDRRRPGAFLHLLVECEKLQRLRRPPSAS